MAKKQIVFMNKITGNIKVCRTKLEGQILGKDWVQIEFVKNDKGEPVMRVNFGPFIVDILENGEREVTPNGGNGNTE